MQSTKGIIMDWFLWIPISIGIAMASVFVLLVLGWIGIAVYGIVSFWVEDIKEFSRKDDSPITDKQARRVIWRNYYRKHPEKAEL